MVQANSLTRPRRVNRAVSAVMHVLENLQERVSRETIHVAITFHFQPRKPIVAYRESGYRKSRLHMVLDNLYLPTKAAGSMVSIALKSRTISSGVR